MVESATPNMGVRSISEVDTERDNANVEQASYVNNLKKQCGGVLVWNPSQLHKETKSMKHRNDDTIGF